VTIYVGGDNQTTAFSGAISGAGEIVKTGVGLLQLSGSNSYAGGTDVTAGTLQLGNNSALGSGALAVNSGVLDLAGFSPTVLALSGSAGTITNSGAAATLSVNQSTVTTFSGTINDGAGQVALEKSATGSLTLTGTSTYSGGTTLNNGTLVVTNPASLGASSGSLTIGPATLEVANGFSESRNIGINGTPSTIQVDAGQTCTNTGNIFGSGELTLSGSGNFVVAGSGAVQKTNLPVGTLTVNGQFYSEVLNITLNSDGSGQGSGQLAGSGSLALGGDGMVYNSTAASTFAGTLSSTSSVAGLEVDSGTLTLSGTNTLQGGTTVDGTGTLILTNSEAIADGTSLLVGDASAFSQVEPAARLTAPAAATISAVPEPGTLGLLAIAAGAVGLLARCRRQRKLHE
jgi:autotransporter-associated beta strand protein